MSTSSSPNEVSSAAPLPKSSNFVTVLSNFWYVCLVVVVMAVVALVFVCACIVRKKRRQGRLQISQIHLQSADSASRPSPAATAAAAVQHSVLKVGSGGGSLSIGQSPIPSPQPSFSSSHKSARSSGRGSGRKKRRNHSPGYTSSGSEDTIRAYQGYSMSSLASSVSTVGPHSGRGHRTESISSGCVSTRGRGSELAGDSHHRPATNAQVKVTAVSDRSSLHSAPSTLSINSNQSRSSRLPPHLSSTTGLVKVDVNVHLDQEKVAPFEIAAALAESARQLAQSAANFEQEDGWMSHRSPFHYSRPGSNLSSPRASISGSSNASHAISRRQLFSNHSSSALFREQQNSFPMVSLDRPGNAVSLDRPGNAVSLDRQKNVVNLDRLRLKEHRRRNSATGSKAFDSESLVSSHSQRHNAALAEHNVELRTPDALGTNMVEVSQGYISDGSSFRKLNPVDYNINGIQRYYVHTNHWQAGEPERPPAHVTEEGPTPTASLDFSPSCRVTTSQASRRRLSDHGSRSGTETGGSNASTLKAQSHSEQRQSPATNELEAESGSAENTVLVNNSPQNENRREYQHSRNLASEPSRPSPLKSTYSPTLPLARPQETESPSPHSSSQASLSRSGSGLSLDPELSSTASGYAATGSTSSLDTPTKKTQSCDSTTVAAVARANPRAAHGQNIQDQQLLRAEWEMLEYAQSLDRREGVMLFPHHPVANRSELQALSAVHYPHNTSYLPLLPTSEVFMRHRDRVDHNDNDALTMSYPQHIGPNRQQVRGLPHLPHCSPESITIDV